MKKISITISGKTYDINVDDAFANLLENAIKEDLNIEGNNSVKTLLEAYLKKNYECFKLKKKLTELLKKFEKSSFQ
ncbi:hypothetical protein [Nitrosophilus kaiyonis]|uniref:hypothetical protein n=1 Tax=Nitrosophilus kaiyonis TaxID=2930200 RepID=UPI00248F9E0F|nr:hypothetical protein [Nitrosophilus kaiyonis]